MGKLLDVVYELSQNRPDSQRAISNSELYLSTNGAKGKALKDKKCHINCRYTALYLSTNGAKGKDLRDKMCRINCRSPTNLSCI